MSRTPKRPKRYNVELAELVKVAKPWSARELAEITERLGDKLEAERWKEAHDQERND